MSGESESHADESRSIIGPVLGGGLSRPTLYYPHLFPPGSIWDRFPYLLPNLICFVVIVCGVIFGLLFLKETHPELKHRRDPFLEAGEWLCRKVKSPRAPVLLRSEKGRDGETESLLKHAGVQYSTVEIASDRPSSSGSTSTCVSDAETMTSDVTASEYSTVAKRNVFQAFNKNVLLNIGGYFLLA